MIVYGTRSTLLKTELIHEPCPNCNKNFVVQMNVFQRYAHIFWIPFFAVGKTGVSQCTNCGQVLKLAAMPDALKAGYEQVNNKTRIPVWTFSGLGLVALVAVGVAINDGNKSKSTDDYVLNPKVGDVVQVKMDTVYTVIKLTSINKDSIYFVSNNFQSPDESDLDEIEQKPYDTTVLSMAKTRLSQLKKDGKILNIER